MSLEVYSRQSKAFQYDGYKINSEMREHINAEKSSSNVHKDRDTVNFSAEGRNIIYDIIPVVGPTFYYKAVGISNIAHGIFPDVQYYFSNHHDCLPSPGYTDGIFYHLVEDAKAAGERPTAAFPSSHVGVSTICMLLAWHSKNRKLLFIMLPFYILLCLATVYKNPENTVVCKNVSRIDVDGEYVLIRDILGEEIRLQGKIKMVDLANSIVELDCE